MVITTINSPSEAIKKFDCIEEFKLMVVGDNKTPNNWKWGKSTYLSIDQQKSSSFKLASLLPENHYCRKNLGYLFAIAGGATTIYDTDDDNYPYEYWKEPSSKENIETTSINQGFVNILRRYTTQHIWPRGLPLDKILESPVIDQHQNIDANKVIIWQGLADRDPDVDAIYRLTNNTPCIFENRGPVILNKGTIAPFNSQNTFFSLPAFPLLYLPSFVTFRFTDILRGLIAQPILWAEDMYLGYFDATVYQERNPHDYLKDFESELPCYLHPYTIIDSVSSVVKSGESISSNLFNAYSILERKGIVSSKELDLVDAWLNDIQNIQ